MVEFFRCLAKDRAANEGKRLPTAFSSHRADAERIVFFGG